MYSFAKKIGCAVVWAAVSCAGGAMGGQPPVKPQNEKQEATKLIPEPERPNAVSQRPTAELLPTLRCWQDGRLIVEQAGVKLSDAPQGAYVFKRRAANDTTVYVFDMKNGLCTLSYEAVNTPRP
jgi:hypothetical protein